MKCPKCENEVENTANFCPKCGNDITLEKFFGSDAENNTKPEENVNHTPTKPVTNPTNQKSQEFQQPQNSAYYPPQSYYPPQPTTPPYPQYQPYYSPQPAPASEKNGMAIAGFVCSFFVPILGWVFGGIGLSKAKKLNGKGKGFSIASIAIATVMFFIYLSNQ